MALEIMVEASVNINGALATGTQAVVSVFDHGFLYGDGVYETLRTYNRQPFLLEQHFARLRASAARLSLGGVPSNEELEARILATMASVYPSGELVIRIIVTRGVGELSYDPAACPVPTTVIIVRPHQNPPDSSVRKGIRLIVASVVRNHPLSVDPSIKSNNLLNNILAMQEAIRLGADEAILLNHRGEFTECSQSNLFAVKDGVVSTPPLNAGLLAGVTRNLLFQLSTDINVPIREGALHESDLDTIDELFVTSTTREIMPVISVGNRTIGSGQPGPITSNLLARLRSLADATTRNQ